MGDNSDPANMTPVEKNGINSRDGPEVKVTEVDGVQFKPNGSDTDAKEKKKKTEAPKSVGLIELFQFADKWDVLCMVVGGLSALIHGAGLPMLMIVFGDMTDAFINFAKQSDFNFTAIGLTPEEAFNAPEEFQRVLAANNQTFDFDPDALNEALLPQMKKFALYYLYIGVGVLVFACGQVALWLIASTRQAHQIRIALFRAILRQEIGWMDTHEIGELNTRLTEDVNKIQDGTGDKVGNFLQWTSCTITGIIIGFIYGWKLTLVIMAFAPLIAISAAFMTKLTTSYTGAELDAYAKAGAVAEEVLGAIRTVVAFGGQEKEQARYIADLNDARRYGIRKGLVSGAGMGGVFLVIFCVYAMAFWYGSKLVREDDAYTAGTMLIVFFAVVIAAFALGNAAPNLGNLATARAAAYTIFEIIHNVPSIDSSSDAGQKPDSMEGNIEFRDVVFRYPARPEMIVLDGFNLRVPVSQTVALVGASGCGKSTTVQLVQRFYDLERGAIFVDGINIKDLNVKWLRQHIGIVSQEPILFATTIGENIRYGREGVTQAEVEQAAKEANAHDFISKLPQRYDTVVGERGAQLSGGQKQRIAIARALVRDPKILLLDEATSALDTESEATVQTALDKVKHGRTTIVIAHRLSTIKTANQIAGVMNGRVAEQGTHEELMSEGGIYHTLVTNQTSNTGEDDEEVSSVDIGRGSLRGSKHGLSKASLKRLTSTISNNGVEEEEEEKLPDPNMGRVFKLNAPEGIYIAVGCLCSIIAGAIQPAFAIIFSEIIGVFAKPVEEQESGALLFSLMFVVIGVVNGAALLIYFYMFAVSGEALTVRLRSKAFRAMLRQDISYFDDSRNSTGALTARLATDTSAVQGVTGARLGSLCQSLSSIGIGIIIGFVFSWKLTLTVLGFVPFIMIGGLLQMKILQGYASDGKEALETASKYATEAVENMRTVASLTREDAFLAVYAQSLEGPYRNTLKKAVMNGAAFSFTQALIFFAYAACFVVGAILVEQGELTFEDMFKVFMAIVFGAMAAGQASHFAPDYGKGKAAASRLFQLFDRVPLIDSFAEDGDTLPQVSGSVEFENVKFMYPTRPTVTVLQGLNLKVTPGKTLALVGSSGCGKSTTVQLTERFYDVAEGSVKLDGRPVTSLNVQWLRSQMGIVSQEPILFDCSIRENIAYGDNSRDVAMDEVIAAARNANIHEFIASLPDGYETNVGDKGTQLSGGQKQRVAIARALLRNPKILLLDEATSALDTESEKVVQEALDRAQSGRTSIVIAHRLSTIQNADQICVFNAGQVVEQGTHAQLLAVKGFYYRLHNAQLRQKS